MSSLSPTNVLPPALEPHFSERVLRLPRCFQPSDTRRALPPPATREACGLPANGVVLCCFNNSYKLNPASVDRALAVLRQVPGSVLWLLSGPGRADDRLRAHAQARGIDPARLVFMAKQPHAEYLARLQQADLFLDTGPYNAHTTASDALWAGCPVLTRPGDTFAARVAGSRYARSWWRDARRVACSTWTASRRISPRRCTPSQRPCRHGFCRDLKSPALVGAT